MLSFLPAANPLIIRGRSFCFCCNRLFSTAALVSIDWVHSRTTITANQCLYRCQRRASLYIFARVCVREHKLQIRSFRYARSAVLTHDWKSGVRKTNLFSRIKSAYSLFFFYRFYLLLLLLLWRIFFFSSFVLCSLAGFLRLRLIKVYVYNLDTLSNWGRLHVMILGFLYIVCTCRFYVWKMRSLKL